VACSRVPKDVRDFVAGHLPSVDDLEALMLLQRTAARSWSSPELAAELRISESTAEAVLERLASCNFLDVKISNDVLFRFNPVSPDLGVMAARCAECYVRDRSAMINLVTPAATALEEGI
jgi:hypothetical protein